MDPVKHLAAYERMKTLQQIADEIRIARPLRVPKPETPATPPRPAPVARRERCPDDLAHPHPA